MESIATDIAREARVRLVNGNSLDVLSQLKPASVDLVLTSPPYNIGKDYERVLPMQDYLSQQRAIIQQCVRALKPGGNICWQVGFTKSAQELVPLDVLLFPIFKEFDLQFANRIIWTFGHGMHAKKRFSGRHETILWFRKPGQEPYWDLDSVRVPQKYPGKRHYKGPRKGEYSGNLLGKNPGDVWDIPNVKANHSEKTAHQCQFPVGLAQRVIRAMSPKNGLVLDPFAGVATTMCAAVIEGRRSLGIEMSAQYHELGLQRVREALDGTLKYRDISEEKSEPTPNTSLTQRKS